MKKFFAMILAAALLLAAAGAYAENPEAFAQQKEKAIAALMVSLPDAAVDYAVRERDDGRYEWNLFFTQNGSLGVCKVLEEKNEIRRVELYAMREGMLLASEAVAELQTIKPGAVVVDLDLDWDDGVLCYEGDARLDGKRYEFEMTAAGRMIEWERD